MTTLKTRIHTFYEMKEGRLVRNRRYCPRCGIGYFMADMYDRIVCGNCGFTEFKKVKGKKPAPKSAEEKQAKKAAKTKKRVKRPRE